MSARRLAEHQQHVGEEVGVLAARRRAAAGAAGRAAPPRASPTMPRSSSQIFRPPRAGSPGAGRRGRSPRSAPAGRRPRAAAGRPRGARRPAARRAAGRRRRPRPSRAGGAIESSLVDAGHVEPRVRREHLAHPLDVRRLLAEVELAPERRGEVLDDGRDVDQAARAPRGPPPSRRRSRTGRGRARSPPPRPGAAP